MLVTLQMVEAVETLSVRGCECDEDSRTAVVNAFAAQGIILLLVKAA